MNVCSICKQELSKECFSKRQWLQSDSKRKCKKCVEETEATSVTTGNNSKTSTSNASNSTSLPSKIESMSISGLKPPRPVEKILGRIGPNSFPTKKIVNELLEALDYEFHSPSHQKVVAQLKSNDAQTIDDPLKTYETDGMIKMKQYFLFGSNRNAPFSFVKMDLPEQKIRVLRDKSMGESDYNSKWIGGECLVLKFKDLSKKSSLGIFCVYMGECYFTPKDLWDLAVHFRKGQSTQVWPDHRSVLLCPFCANLANPDERKTKYVMITRLILQTTSTGIAFQSRPQLCCRSCFVDNHNISLGEEWEKFPKGCQQHGVATLCKHVDSSMPESNCPDAYTMVNWFEFSGMQSACCKEYAASMSNATSECSDLKMKPSKSLTKANRGQLAIKMKSRREEKTCHGCGLKSENASACSVCQNTYYCSRDCQRLHWKVHKKYCSENNVIEAYPSHEILVNNKVRVSVAEMENEKNFCKICLQFRGDNHGKDAYCFGCASFLFCGPCNGKPEANNGEIHDGESGAFAKVCEECSRKVAKHHIVSSSGKHLRFLLREKPTGMHVNHLRLCLAQLMLNDTEKITGIAQDVEAAKQEYLWLANNLDYAPAQFALASLHDPLCHLNGAFHDGPLRICIISKELKKSPFDSNAQIAKKYYERSCEQKLSTALNEVGIFYKNGCHSAFPQKFSKGIALIQEAAEMGNTRAMANLARYYYSIGEEKKFVELKLKAANNGGFMAMFAICQFGMHDSNLFKKGKEFIELLISNSFSPPQEIPNGVEKFLEVAHFYGHTLELAND